MSAVPEIVDDAEYQPLYAANLLANMASQIVQKEESTTGWDKYEGFIDPTNTDRYVEQTKNAYVLIIDSLSASLGTPDVLAGLTRLNIPQVPGRFDWVRRFASPLMFPGHSEIADMSKALADHLIYDSISKPLPVTETQKTEKEGQFQLLYEQLEDEISNLERDIHSSIRDALRDDLYFLLATRIQELGQGDDPLRVRSVRALYRFLGVSQCTKAPDLSLAADGNVYARWRQSRNRSIGAFFQNGSTVHYALRNLPKQHGGTTSPAEFWSQIRSLGFIDLIRPTIVEQEA